MIYLIATTKLRGTVLEYSLRQGRAGPGQAKSNVLALDPMRAGPEHQKSGPTLGPNLAISPT